MKYKVTIKTPSGSAESAAAKIKLQMLPVAVPEQTLFNEDRSEITFTFDSTPKKYGKVISFFILFNVTIEKTWNSRTFQYMLKNKSKSEIAKLKPCYFNPAKVTITQEPTTEELVASQKSIWEKVKDKVRTC